MRRVFHVPASETQMGLVLALCIFTMSVYVHRPPMAGPGHRQAERRHSHARNAFRRLIGPCAPGNISLRFTFFRSLSHLCALILLAGEFIFGRLHVNRFVVVFLLSLFLALASAAQHPGCFTTGTNKATQHICITTNITAAKKSFRQHHGPSAPRTLIFFQAIPETQEGPQPGVGALLVILLCRVVSSSYCVRHCRLAPHSGVLSVVSLLSPVEVIRPSGNSGSSHSLLLPGTARRKGNLQKSSKRTYSLAYLSFGRVIFLGLT